MISMHKTSFKINKNSEPFIIAEAGINHNGNIGKALEMIHVAKNAGADAIKFQAFKASGIVADSSLTYTYTSQGSKITEPQMDLFQRCELNKQDFLKIKKECEKEGILFIATPENRTDLDMLLEIGISAIKVGSDDFTNIPLLKDYSTTGLPMIISCGMANLKEIETTMKALKNHSVVLMLTTSLYPTEPSEVNLLKFKTLKKLFPNLLLGYSDHTQSNLASPLALVFGAKIFEKHFTLDNTLPGPDHWFSEDPNGLKNWIESIRTSKIMLGTKKLEPTKKEEEMKKIARRSIVALKDIDSNEILDRNNVGIRRPGTGLSPEAYEKILQKRTTRKIKKGELIKLEDCK